MIEGEPTILIHNGKILENNMKKTRYNIEDLISELRQNNIFDIKDVHFAILETNGRLSTLPISDDQTVTRKDLNIKGEEETVNAELVLDGKVIKSNLEQHQLTAEWLENKIKEQNVSLEEITLVEYNPIDESLYFDFKGDNLGKDKVDISDND